MLGRVRHTDWLLTASERANAQTILDDRHPDDEAWSEGNLVRPLIHGSTYFAELYERLQATQPGDLVYFTDWQGDADELLTGEPGSEVVEVLGSCRRARRRRTRSDLALAHGEDELQRRREPPARPTAPATRRRGAARHARPDGWLAPPEAGGHPPPRPSRARHRLRRRHRPVPLPPRRRHPSRGPAGARDGLGVRRHPALARRDGGDHRACGVRRRDGLPGAVAGPDPADPAPALLDPGQDPADGHDAGPAARAGAAAALAGRRHPDRPAAADLSRTCGTVATTRSRGAASAASRAATPRRSSRPDSWSTSRTSTSGASRSETCSPRRCARTPTCT